MGAAVKYTWNTKERKCKALYFEKEASFKIGT